MKRYAFSSRKSKRNSREKVEQLATALPRIEHQCLAPSPWRDPYLGDTGRRR